jgi:hypothetical protein
LDSPVAAASSRPIGGGILDSPALAIHHFRRCSRYSLALFFLVSLSELLIPLMLLTYEYITRYYGVNSGNFQSKMIYQYTVTCEQRRPSLQKSALFKIQHLRQSSYKLRMALTVLLFVDFMVGVCD